MLLDLEWITSKKYFERYGELYKKLPTDRSEADSLAFEKKASKCAHPNRNPKNCDNLSSLDDLARIFTCDNPQRCHMVESSKQVKPTLVENSTNDEKADFFSKCATDTVDGWVPVKRKKPFRVQPKDAAFSKRAAFSKGAAFKKINNLTATCGLKQHKDYLLTNPMSGWASQKTSSKNKWRTKRRRKTHKQKTTRRRKRRRSKRVQTAPMVGFKPHSSSKVDFVAQPIIKPPSYPKTGNEAYVDGTSCESVCSMTKETKASASKQSTAKPIALQKRPKVFKCTRWLLTKSSPSIKNVRSKMRVNEPAGHCRRVYKGIMVEYSFIRTATNCKLPKKRGITRKPINKVFLKLTMFRIPFCTKRTFAFFHKEFDHLTINGARVITPSTTISGSRVFAVEGLMIQWASFRVLKGPFFEFAVDWSSKVKVLEKVFLEHNPSRIKICKAPNISWAVGILRVYWLNSMKVIDLRNIPVEGETSVIDHEMKTFIWDPGGSAAF
ncbi:uncharacterized protein [Watersipora subatra]|uniref:uncharacterized protein n=1 Tax=Watersipora subatra TaxID=2589382 RepID=UPI00355BB4E0